MIRSRMPIALALVLTVGLVEGCWLKPVLRTIKDVAYDLCVLERQAEAPKLSAEDIGKAFCATEDSLKPFLDAVLSAQKLARQRAAAPSAAVAPSTAPVTPSTAPVTPSAAPSASVRKP